MNDVRKILVITIFFVIFVMFMGTVSAANWTVNPGNSIQAAVNNASSNDTIIVNDDNGTDYTYIENIVINKKLTLTGASGRNVTVKALDPNLPVFRININGSGSVIQNFIITGATGFDCSSIYIDNSNNNVILGNIIHNNCRGILINHGSNNIISDSNIKHNQWDGVKIRDGVNNTVYGNTISHNMVGLYVYGFYAANISFNNIIQNDWGLYIEEGIVNAQNNWWGSNNPTESWNSPTDIYIDYGIVNYDPWLVLKVNATPSTVSNQNSTITADLTHNNQGGDTSSQGHIPDNIPVNFATNLGTITGTACTRNGKANAAFNRGTSISGIANITATLANQLMQTNVTLENIDTTAPIVTVNPAGGVYNTAPVVTLTVMDDFDPNPVIYYTVNGSDPTTSSTRYVSPINIPTTTILKLMAVDSAGNQAQVQTINYTINLPIININTNKTYSRIQDAIDDNLTLNGHIIEVKNGTYTENIIINKQLILRPVFGVNVTIQTVNSSKPVITITSGGSGSTIQGFTLICATSSHGINLNDANNCTVNGNTITNSWDAIRLDYSNNNIITGNTITNIAATGIYLWHSNNNTLIGNTITNNPYGIWLYYSNNNTIQSNTVTNIDHYGIALTSSNNNTIQNNKITNNSWMGIELSHSNDNTIQNNNITDNTWYG
ncbi:MAG: NosD domain-containing protein, partial [Methanobacterium sp.]